MKLLGFILIFLMPVSWFVYAWFIQNTDQWERANNRAFSIIILGAVLIGTGIYLINL